MLKSTTTQATANFMILVAIGVHVLLDIPEDWGILFFIFRFATLVLFFLGVFLPFLLPEVE